MKLTSLDVFREIDLYATKIYLRGRSTKTNIEINPIAAPSLEEEIKVANPDMFVNQYDIKNLLELDSSEYWLKTDLTISKEISAQNKYNKYLWGSIGVGIVILLAYPMTIDLFRHHQNYPRVVRTDRVTP
jgi:hypothetical protein